MIEFKNCDECHNIEVAKPFVLKTYELFQNEFSMEVTDIEMIKESQTTEVNNINFVSNLSGSITANLIFSFEKPVAKKLLDSFPYLEYTPDIEEEMIMETVAEFLNIVIGNAMRDLDNSQRLIFSPPVGLSGENKLFYGKNFELCKIKLTLNEGEMLIVFGTPNKDN